MRLSEILRGAVQFRVLDYLVCVIFGVIGWAVGHYVRPHCRPFSWTDPRIGYPHAVHPAFPSWTLAPITVMPGVFYVLSEGLLVYLSYTRRCTLHVESLYACSSVLSTCDGTRRIASASSVPIPTSASGTACSVVADTTQPIAGSKDKSFSVVVTSGDNGDLDAGERGEPRVTFGDGRRVDLPAIHNLAEHPWRFFLLRAHYWVLTQALAVTFAMLIVDTVKVYAGRLRPDFLSRLRLDGLTPDSIMSSDEWCRKARGGRLSFPSGHSALSFAAFVPLVFYLQNVLRCFGGAPFPCGTDLATDASVHESAVQGSPTSATPHSSYGSRASRQRGGRTGPSAPISSAPPSSRPAHTASSKRRAREVLVDYASGLAGTLYARCTLGLVPLILPIAVAISRTVDYRHNFDDIVAGSLIGVATALLAVLLNFRCNPVCGGLTPRQA